MKSLVNSFIGLGNNKFDMKAKICGIGTEAL